MKLARNTVWHRATRYLVAVLLGAACAVLCLPLAGWLELANIVMLFLLTVAITAAWLGQGPGILAAFLSVALFDVLFVEPRFSFAVNDSQYLVTFVVMLLVALLISHLSSLLQRQLHQAQQREQRTRVLYGRRGADHSTAYAHDVTHISAGFIPAGAGIFWLQCHQVAAWRMAADCTGPGDFYVANDVGER